jgi:hypothetical protein
VYARALHRDRRARRGFSRGFRHVEEIEEVEEM